MNVDDGSIRELTAPQADPELSEREVAISVDQAMAMLMKNLFATCRSCGRQMAGDGKSLTGTCSDCIFKASAQNLAAYGKLLPRRERRLRARMR